MANHNFNFDGGYELMKMCASWFVAYAYYTYIDCEYKIWDKVSTAQYRASVFRRNEKFHKHWLEQVLLMNENNLDRNTMGISGAEVKQMAKEILQELGVTKKNNK